MAAGAAGCGGGSDFKDKPRPPAPLELTGAITDRGVSVEPGKFGAGPISLIISNQTQQSHTVTLEGGPTRISEQVGPINPLDTGRIQESLGPGHYKVTVGSSRASSKEIKPAELTVGPARGNSSDQVLLP